MKLHARRRRVGRRIEDSWGLLRGGGYYERVRRVPSQIEEVE
jgi:hypothetical protein